MTPANQPRAQVEVTEADRALVRRVQHFHNDNVRDGIPCGDWHVECHPDHGAMLIAQHVAARVAEEAAELRATLAAVDAGLAKEFGPLDKRSGDLIDDMEAFVMHHKEKEAQLAASRERERGLRAVIQGVIESCVHPDRAVRAVMVDLAPLRAALAAAPTDAKAIQDNPEFDGTDGAHPAWWRGEKAGVVGAAANIQTVLDHGLAGFSQEPLESVRKQVGALKSTIAELQAALAKAHPDTERLEKLFRTHGHTLTQAGENNLLRFEWAFNDPDFRAAIDALP